MRVRKIYVHVHILFARLWRIDFDHFDIYSPLETPTQSGAVILNQEMLSYLRQTLSG